MRERGGEEEGEAILEKTEGADCTG